MPEELQKVVVIVGPTASGKSALAIAVAKKFNGEVISADSRQVYQGLDLGTGKITEKEMDGVKHHLLDVEDPTNVYTASDFARDGRKAIADIVQRNKLPIIAGGSFFYIDSLLGEIETPEVPPNPELREKLEKMSVEALYTALLKSDPRRAEEIDPHNKRRLVRALEVIEALGRVPEQKSKLLYTVLTIGIKTERKNLYENIAKRIDERLADGMMKEVETLHNNGLTYERMEDLGLEYRYISRFLQKRMTREAMVEELNKKTRQFAKRQLTWLKRDKNIRWFRQEEHEQIFLVVETFLNS